MTSEAAAPHTTAYYRIDPAEEIDQAAAGARRLFDALAGGPLVSRKDDGWIYSGPWIEEVRRGLAVAPAVLLHALDQLPARLHEPGPIAELIEDLARLALFRLSRAGDAVRLSPSPCSLARLALEHAASARPRDAVRVLAALWDDLDRSTQDEAVPWVQEALETLGTPAPGARQDALKEFRLSPFPEGRRERIIILASGLVLFAGRINIPETYDLLIQLLDHHWPEIRDTAARSLHGWQAPDLMERLGRALLRGKEDPAAVENTRRLLYELGSRKDPAALPYLREIQGSALDGPRVRKAIRQCAGLREPARRQRVWRKTPLFDSGMAVAVGRLPGGDPAGVGASVDSRRRSSETGVIRVQAGCSVQRLNASTPREAFVGRVILVALARHEIESSDAAAVCRSIAAHIWDVQLDDPPGENPAPPLTLDAQAGEPALLYENGAVCVYLRRQRDYRPYWQGLVAELELRDGEDEIATFHVHALHVGDPERVLQAAWMGVWAWWRRCRLFDASWPTG